MKNLPSNLRGRKLSDEIKTDPETGQKYRATLWNVGGHKTQINQDLDTGAYHVKGGGSSVINTDEGGVIDFLLRMLGLIK